VAAAPIVMRPSGRGAHGTPSSPNPEFRPRAAACARRSLAGAVASRPSALRRGALRAPTPASLTALPGAHRSLRRRLRECTKNATSRPTARCVRWCARWSGAFSTAGCWSTGSHGLAAPRAGWSSRWRSAARGGGEVGPASLRAGGGRGALCEAGRPPGYDVRGATAGGRAPLGAPRADGRAPAGRRGGRMPLGGGREGAYTQRRAKEIPIHRAAPTTPTTTRPELFAACRAGGDASMLPSASTMRSVLAGGRRAGLAGG